MNAIRDGVLLPQSTLTHPWFLTFALFVAFNTIIYLGLTLSKLTPWPAQIHPARVRALLPPGMTKDTTMKEIPHSRRSDPADEFVKARMHAAAVTIPLALTLVAGLIIIVSTVQLVFVASRVNASYVASYGIALAMLVWAQVCSHAQLTPRMIIWSWALASTILILKLALDGIVFDDPISMTYAAMILVIMPVVSTSWPSSLAGGLIGLLGIIVGGIVVNALDSLQWSIASLAAFGAGLLVLAVRRLGLDRLTLEQMRSTLLATTDPLTGLLSRTGMESLAPALAETAEAHERPVHIVMYDIDDMTAINADYGLEYGDAVIKAVARSLESCTAHGTLLCRWDGDRFLALGLGEAPGVSGLAGPLDEALVATGIGLGKRPITARISTSSGSPAGSTLESLVARAAQELRSGAPRITERPRPAQHT